MGNTNKKGYVCKRAPITMEDWAKRLDLFLMEDGRAVLQDTGKITAEIAKAKVEIEFERRLNDNEMFKLWK